MGPLQAVACDALGAVIQTAVGEIDGTYTSAWDVRSRGRLAMMLIKDVMTRTPACSAPSDTLQAVAKQMLEHDCGEIPVCDGGKVVGVITDRDITIRAVAAGKTPAQTRASEVMTRNVYTVGEDDTIDAALALIEEKVIRRLPVVDSRGGIVGIVRPI